MKKYQLACFIIICLSFTRCTTSTKTKETNGFEIRFTTTSVLNARKTASVNGEVILEIPYGTLLNVKKTDVKSKYNEKEDFWYYSKEIDGYVFGTFLSDKKPDGDIKYILYSNRGDEYCPEDYSTIILSNMKAMQTIERECHIESRKSQIYGTYTIHNGYIEINWDDSYMISTSYFDKKITKSLNKGEIDNLYWNVQAKGWLTEYAIKQMSNRKCVYLTTDSIFDCTESCEALNKKSGCKKESELSDYDYARFRLPVYSKKKK